MRSEAKKIPYKTLVERARGWLEEKQTNALINLQKVHRTAEGLDSGNILTERK